MRRSTVQSLPHQLVFLGYSIPFTSDVFNPVHPKVVMELFRGDLENLKVFKFKSGNTKGGSITVLLTSCLTGLD